MLHHAVTQASVQLFHMISCCLALTMIEHDCGRHNTGIQNTTASQCDLDKRSAICVMQYTAMTEALAHASACAVCSHSCNSAFMMVQHDCVLQVITVRPLKHTASAAVGLVVNDIAWAMLLLM